MSASKGALVVGAITFVTTLLYSLQHESFYHYIMIPAITRANVSDSSQTYAVYACSTPRDGSHRGYDYAFYLPLTALAWERLNYSSIVLLIGTKQEWEEDPPLKQVLVALSERDARIIFLDARLENRAMLSQTARLFVANMNEAKLDDDDFILTTDADLWPLRRNHFARRSDFHLFLVHSQCCGTFEFQQKNYTMLPMSHIGATTKVWKDIVNKNGIVARNAETILDYFEDRFGTADVAIRKPVDYDSEEWYLDQKLVSILISEWMERSHTQSKVYKVSDRRFTRFDRIEWDAETVDEQGLKQRYDAHLPFDGYLPGVWSSIRPLVNLMYGSNSSQTKWCNEYALKFFTVLNVTQNESETVGA